MNQGTAQKLKIAADQYEFVFAMKRHQIRKQQPHLTEAELKELVRKLLEKSDS